MVRIAITGGIACGKSLAGEYLADRGVAVCDADVLAHALMAPGTPCSEAIRAHVGEEVMSPDGSVNRQALAPRVFADSALREWLEALLHPRVQAAWEAWCEAQEGAIVAVVVPLLYEGGFDAAWDAVVCIGASPAVQRGRLRERGLTEEEAAQRIAAQWRHNRKAERADYVVWNDGPVTLLHKQLDDVLARLRETDDGHEA